MNAKHTSPPLFDDLRAALLLSNPLRPPPKHTQWPDAAHIVRRAHALGTAEAVTAMIARHLPGLSLQNNSQHLYLENLARNMINLQAADEARKALEDNNIRTMPFKGYAFLLDLYDHDVGLRRMFDLDLLLDTTTFTQALSILAARGWERELDAPITGRVNVEALITKKVAGQKVRMELHRALTFPGRYRIRPREVWDHAHCGPKGWRMAPEDTLLYLAMHKAQHGWCNDCRDMVDATNLVFAHLPDWSRIIKQAREWACTTAAWAFFGRARRAFGLPITDATLRALAPSRARRALIQQHLPDPTRDPQFMQRRNNVRPLARKTAISLLMTDAPLHEVSALGAIALRNLADKVASTGVIPEAWIEGLDHLPLFRGQP